MWFVIYIGWCCKNSFRNSWLPPCWWTRRSSWTIWGRYTCSGKAELLHPHTVTANFSRLLLLITVWRIKTQLTTWGFTWRTIRRRLSEFVKIRYVIAHLSRPSAWHVYIYSIFCLLYYIYYNILYNVYVCRCLRCCLQHLENNRSEFFPRKLINGALHQQESTSIVIVVCCTYRIIHCWYSCRYFINWCKKQSCITPKVIE